jgi:hypothetical protein
MQIPHEIKALVVEISQAWQDHTGFKNAPYKSTVDAWIQNADVIEDVFASIEKTGRKIRMAADAGNPFTEGSGVRYCGGVIATMARDRAALAARNGAQ